MTVPDASETGASLAIAFSLVEIIIPTTAEIALFGRHFRWVGDEKNRMGTTFHMQNLGFCIQ